LNLWFLFLKDRILAEGARGSAEYHMKNDRIKLSAYTDGRLKEMK